MKKLLRFAGVALLTLTIGVVGCDDEEAVTPVAPTTPASIVGTVSGTVSVEGSGLVGVSVNLPHSENGNRGKKSSKFNQDCTIRASCRSVMSESTGSKQRANGINWRA